jgi:D-sedoheptulose 7-phosphate isomerase
VEDAIKKLIEERLLIFNEFRDLCAIEILRVSQAIMSTFSSGNKLLICGNGGSAADSQHLAAEFVSSFSSGLKRKSLPAIALTVDTSIMSAISNDFGFESVFSRQVEGLGVRGDSILLISTSGNSKNCLAALETSKRKGMQVLTLTSQDSELYRLSDLAVGVPSKNTQYIQECHTIAYHIIAELVDLHFTED